MTLLLGLGIIGSRCADNLLKNNIPLHTWNRTPKDRADFTGDLEKSASEADTILCYLKDEHAIREVFSLLTLKKNATFINHATIDPDTTLWLAEKCHGQGAHFLDCPFTGSRDAAANAQLTYYISGENEIIEKHRSLLELTSRLIISMGPIPNATIVKITTNLITATTVQALSEALSLCTAHGISPEQYLAAARENGCYSPVIGMKIPAMSSGDYSPHFSTDNMLKDANYSLRLAEKHGLILPAIQTVADQLAKASENGHGADDFSSIHTLHQPST